jgi:DNA polymerase-3 subunit delta'
MDFLSADSLPWLGDAQHRLREARAAGRLPQSLLLICPPGLGGEQLASWITALALCDSPGEAARGAFAPGAPPPGAAARGALAPSAAASGAGPAAPCGVCASCRLLGTDTHPDSHVVRLIDDAQQIKIDQIRSLIEALSLSSYRGGYKVAVVENAEALNANGANAFLKTLEEPTPRTLLVLVAKPSHRLPATIASRCLKVALRAPAKDAAAAWLTERNPSVESWDAALALAGGAPLLALELAGSDIARLDAEMRRALELLRDNAVDVTVLAEGWVKGGSEMRLIWLENWITRRVHAEFGGVTSLQSAEPVVLSAALLKPKIRALFELLDAARELRRLASTGLNQQLALEALLLGGRAALAAK